jgi:predicted RNase H-like HicB family nuclease
MTSHSLKRCALPVWTENVTPLVRQERTSFFVEKASGPSVGYNTRMATYVTLDDYQAAALAQATYETLPDGTISGRVLGVPEVWASAPTLAACRAELRAVLEAWLRQRLADDNLDLPEINGLTPMISTSFCPWHA